MKGGRRFGFAALVKAELVKLKKEQFNLRFQKSSGQLENSSKILQVRRDIARIHTALSEQKRVEE